MSYASLRRRHRQLSAVTSALALILTGFVAYGCYLFVQSPPAAGIGAAVVGVLVVALGYLSWGICGECLSRRWYPSALFAAMVSVSISVCVMYVIHKTIEHSAQQQEAARSADDLGQREVLRQLEVDRGAYQSLLAPATPVVSQERQYLQQTIRDLQEQSRIKRSKNFDKPADRIDESVLKLQEQQADLVRLDAEASDRAARVRAEQAAALQESIKAREQGLASKHLVVVTSLSERVMLIAAVLIELITSGMMLYLARLKGVLDAVGEESETDRKAEVVQGEAQPHLTPIVAVPAPIPAPATAPVLPPASVPQPALLPADMAPAAAPVAHLPDIQGEKQIIATRSVMQAPMATGPVEDLAASSEKLDPCQTASELDAPQLQASDTCSMRDAGSELLDALKPHERQRYNVFRDHVTAMPADQPIKTDAVATALGFGKDLVSTFFKIAGHQAVLQKQGRQWFKYADN